MTELSVIVPFANEYPQVLFTLRNIGEELINRVDFEVIAVNNYCPELERQWKAKQAIQIERMVQHLQRTGYKAESELNEALRAILLAHDEDRGGGSIAACTRGHPWLRYVEYRDKLSHWNAKRVGCENATGQYFLFIDAHCIAGRDSIYDMFNYYKIWENDLNGTIHFPLTYKILEWHRLIYKLVVNNDANNKPAEFTYSFTPLRTPEPEFDAFEVPCMSTCGMLISRRIYEQMGGWPTELGIYGGGENFMNYTLAVLGYHKWIYHKAVLCHHGEKRGYHWNYDDHIRNRILATYLFGGMEVANRFVSMAKGRPEVLKHMLEDVSMKCKEQREKIKSEQKMTIDEWLERTRAE